MVTSVNKNVKLSCDYPFRTVHWTMPKNIHYGNIRISGNILYIDKIQEKNKGRYECFVYIKDRLKFWSNKMQKFIDKDRVLFRARSTVSILGKSTLLVLYYLDLLIKNFVPKALCHLALIHRCLIKSSVLDYYYHCIK